QYIGTSDMLLVSKLQSGSIAPDGTARGRYEARQPTIRRMRARFILPSSRRRHLNDFRKLSTALGISGATQAIGSVANFLLGIYLVQKLSPAEFGVYGIGFATCLFFSGLGNSLFL